MACCLLVEDMPEQSQILSLTLRTEGHETLTASSAAEAIVVCREQQPEIILLDLGLPDADGLELIPKLRAISPFGRIIVLTGRDSARAAVDALHAGARHYLVKPWDREELLLVIDREARAVAFRETEERGGEDRPFWGTHPAILRVRSQIEKLAGSAVTPVLIEGETGTGKEVVARELHRATGASGPFVPLNCAALPTELIESELFGHEHGAFTGAENRRRGLAELAHEGTLFLDEIGEMPEKLQAKLLRFVEDHRFRRIGGEDELTSRCRVVAATHRDLDASQGTTGFRADLYYRLAVVRLHLVPLRDRRDDLLPVSGVLLARLSAQLGAPAKQLSRASEEAILAHDWPGNLRELKNRLERALVLGEGQLIEPDDLDLFPPPSARCERESGPTAAKAGVDGLEPQPRGVGPSKEELARVMAEAGGNLSLAARRLGVPRHWLKYRLTKLGLRKPREAT